MVRFGWFCYVVSCCVMLCHVVPCCVMLCHVVSCCVRGRRGGRGGNNRKTKIMGSILKFIFTENNSQQYVLSLSNILESILLTNIIKCFTIQLPYHISYNTIPYHTSFCRNYNLSHMRSQKISL